MSGAWYLGSPLANQAMDNNRYVLLLGDLMSQAGNETCGVFDSDPGHLAVYILGRSLSFLWSTDACGRS